MRLELYFTSFTKVNPMWINNTKIKPESIKYTEENIDKTLHKIDQSGIFKEMTTETKATKKKKRKKEANTLHHKAFHNEKYPGYTKKTS